MNKKPYILLLMALTLGCFGLHSAPRVSHPDYVSTALDRFGPQVAGMTSHYNINREVFLQVWTTRTVDISTWPLMPSKINKEIIKELATDGWEVTREKEIGPQLTLQPFQNLLIAKTEDSRIEVLYTIFPSEHGTIRLVYSLTYK